MSAIDLLSLYAWVSYHVGTPVFAVWLFPLMVSWNLVPGTCGYVVLRAIAAEVRPLVGPFVVGQVPAVTFLAVAGWRPLVLFYMFGVWVQLLLWVLLRHEPRDNRWRRRRRRAWRALRGVVRLPRLATGVRPVGGQA